jgi:type I restriction enzyme S subunit
MWALNSPIVYAQAVADVGGSTSPHVNIGSIRRFPLPVAPIQEQELIAGGVERAWHHLDELQGVTQRLNKQISRLDSAFLAKAFGGELVPQDSNDEPAEVMLARVRKSNGTEETSGNGRTSGADRRVR